MSFKRATAYVGLASVLAAWLAGAGVLSVPSQAPPSSPRETDRSGTQALADDLADETARLRDRLATAPQPRTPARNPFVFVPRSAPPARLATEPPPAPIAAPMVLPEPPLQLIGVAERKTLAGVTRTAMITADSDELFLLTEGETLGGRYRVAAIGAEVVELTDLVTGAVRRLAMR